MQVHLTTNRAAVVLRRHLLTLAALVPLAITSTATAQTVTELTTGNQLVTYNANAPGNPLSVSNVVSGLVAGDTLTSIDYRPVDGVLIGLGYNSGTGALHVYSLSLSTGVATNVNSNTLTIAIGVTRPIIDFNPTANAIRLTASGAAANNFRITAAGTGTLATDTAFTPDPGMLASAYSRNQPGGGISGATTLYLVSATTLYTQGSVDFFTGSGTSPNTGTLFTVGTLTGVTGTIVGLDITAGSPGTGYLATTAGLYTLDLTNGAATSVGNFAASARDIAVLPVPEPGTWALIVLGGVGFVATTLHKRSRRKTAAV